jgi:outer membrane receptor protein involved in Fe transport
MRLACFGVFFASLVSLNAEEDASLYTLEPYKVTAQFREQDLSDVPVRVDVLQGDFIEDLNIRDIEDFSSFIPNVSIQMQSPNTPSVMMRGMTTDTAESYEETRVSMFIDGVSAAKSRGSAVELFDLERIEVIKGPQSTLFGRGASTGAISIISKRPTDSTDGSIYVGAGNYNQRMFKGYVNMPLASDDTLLFRLAGTYRSYDGYVENLEGRDLNGVESYALRPTLRWNISDKIRLDVIGFYESDETTGTSYKQLIYPTEEGYTGPFAAAQLNRGDELGVDRKVRGLTADLLFDISESLQFKSITSYRDYDSYEEADSDGTQAYLAELADFSSGEQFSQEFRLLWTLNDRWDSVLGASYLHDRASNTVTLRSYEGSAYTWLSSPLNQSVASLLSSQYELMGYDADTAALLGQGTADQLIPVEPTVNADGSVNVVNSLPLGFAMLPGYEALAGYPLTQYLEESATNRADNIAYDVFADVTYHFTDKLSFTLGGRYSYEDIMSYYSVNESETPSILALLTRDALTPGNIFYTPTGGELSYGETHSSLVGRFLVNYVFDDTSNVYASISEGRRPPVIRVDETGPLPLEAETVVSYELGWRKAFLNKRLTTDLSVFHYAYDDYSTVVVRDLLVIPENGGKVDSTGVELSLRALLMPGLQCFASYGYNDASFRDKGAGEAYSGTRPRLSSKHSISLGFEWLKSVSDLGDIFVTPTFVWRSKYYFTEDYNEEALSQGDYGLFNLRMGVRRGDWEISLFGNNLFDKEYYMDAGNTGRDLGLSTYIMARPRMWGIGLSRSF